MGASAGAGDLDVEACLDASPLIRTALGRLDGRGPPGWLLAAGAVTQTVWNAAHGFSAAHGIDDLDVVFFDPSGDDAAERRTADDIGWLLADLGVPVDVKNQARVHEWYPDRFGEVVAPYASMTEALSSWPSTATAVGARRVGGRVEVVAPFGLDDLRALVVRPNRVQVPPEVYRAKAGRWGRTWPRLTVLPWSAGIGVPGARVLRSSHRVPGAAGRSPDHAPGVEAV